MIIIKEFFKYDEKEIISEVIETFNNKGFTSFEYNIDNIKDFKGKMVFNTSDIEKCANIELVSYYGYFLTKSIIDLEFERICNTTIARQLNKANKEGLLCHYITVLMATLLRRLSKIDCTMVQGYCNFKTKFGMDQLGFGSLIEPTNYYGIHTFTTYNNGQVLDVTFMVENPDFTPQSCHINGIVPENLTLRGWEETHETEQKYLNMFCEWDNLTIIEWLTMHMAEFKKLTERMIEERQDEEHE